MRYYKSEIMSEKTIIVGIACDKYKSKRYRNQIKKAGHKIIQIVLRECHDIIQVEIKESKMNEFKNLVENLERKYSLRNRIN